ncbi:hypothetical protein H9X54_000935, partial [Flavobacterium macrobrachii]
LLHTSVRVIFYFKNASFWNRKLYREPLEGYNRFSIQFYSIALRKTTRSDVLRMIFLLLPSSVRVIFYFKNASF